jgi:hypothetical protein
MIKDIYLRACASATFVLALGSAPIAQADPTFHTTGYAMGSQQFGLSIGGSTNAGAFKGTWNGDPIVFWCVELDQTFGFGQDYTYTPSLPSSALFSLLGKLFTGAGGSALSDTKHSAAFQLAIWEIVYDSGNLKLNGGSFKVTNNYGHPDTVTLAQQWLDGLGGFQDGYDVYLLSNPNHQNFITTHVVAQPPRTERVPEPHTLGLLGIAVAAGWLARRGKAIDRA